MKRTDNGNTAGQTFVHGAKLAAGLVGVAVLLAVRDEFSAGWVRVLIAGIAFGILALVLVHVRK